MLLLTFFAAFILEGIGTWISVIGLSALFANSPVIVILAVCLDIAKIVSVSFLYKYAKKINSMMRVYLTVACVTLMLITSTGAFGYLSKEFQHAIQGTNQDIITLSALSDEQGRLQHRKEEIDSQIAKLPDNSVRGRQKLIKSFAAEQDRINFRLVEIDKQLPALKVEAVKKNTEVGPIIYIAQVFNTDPEHAVKWVIMIIIFVFDPLAIALLLAGNFLLEERRKDKFNYTSTLQGEKDDLTDDVETALAYIDDIKHEELGRQRYKEHIAEEFDHLDSSHHGNSKPVDQEDEIPQHENIADREVISLSQVMPSKPPRSQLENIGSRGDVTMNNDIASTQFDALYKDKS